MKRILAVMVVLAGIGGLIALYNYKPQGQSGVSENTGSGTSGTTPGPAPAGVTYKDGTYTGSTVDVGYGPVQVQAVVSGGKITTVNLLQMPSGGHSSDVTAMAGPTLQQEAIQVQSANVDVVSGATLDSQGFSQSLQAALSQASS